MGRHRRRRRRRHQELRQLHSSALATLGAQLAEQEEQAELRARIKREVQEALRTATANAGQLNVFNLAYSLDWRQVKRWFQEFLTGLLGGSAGAEVKYCKLFSSKRLGQRNSGRALLTFASPEAVRAILQRAHLQPPRDSRGGAGGQDWQYCLTASIGHRGQIRLRPQPPRPADVADGRLNEQLLRVTAIQAGNFGQGGAFLAAVRLNERGVEARAGLRGRSMAVLFIRDRKLWKMELLYKQTAGRMQLHVEGDATLSLLCALRHPPKLYRGKREASGLLDMFAAVFGALDEPFGGRSQEFSSLDNLEEEELVWERVGDMCAPSEASLFSAGTSDRKSSPIPVSVASAGGPLGESYVYRLVLPYNLGDLQKKGAHGCLLGKLWRYRMLEEFARPLRCPILDAPFRSAGPGFRLLDLPPVLAEVSLEVAYQLGCLVSQGYIPPCHLASLEGCSLCMAVRDAPEDVAVEALPCMLGGSRPLPDPLQAFLELRAELEAVWEEEEEDELAGQAHRQVAPDLREIKRLLVTPSRVVATGVEQETSNRVLRHYAKHRGRFARVSFGEEDGNRLQGGSIVVPYSLYARMLKVLREGFWIGDEHFHFLAFSSSQLRDQSCWFFAPTGGITPNHIRDWMGDFSDIKVVGKRAARMGQCFSSTLDAAHVMPRERQTIPDVERSGFCFTDGCATVSPQLAREMAAGLWQRGRLPAGLVPTAFQIRFSGVKGMVALDPSLRGRRLCTRPSMEKFEAPHPKLEVIRPTSFMPAYLNRQIVQLLSTLGVLDAVFVRMQNCMATELDAMLQERTAALRVLNKYRGCLDEWLSDALLRMLRAGVAVADPFVHGVLVALRAAMLQGLRHRARIFVDQGCSLIGISDETGVLRPEEVFVCHMKRGAQQPTIVTGPVLVTKKPAFHVGDVRVLQAVDRPELHSPAYASAALCWDTPFNVVVFSQQGDRPLPNKMAGSDLDGDIYFVTWQPDLLPPPARRNRPPMDYKLIDSRVADKVDVAAIQSFFVSFIMKDNLGRIVNAWVAWADQSREEGGHARAALTGKPGAEDPKCVRLAELHSQAVDFAKHGEPAIMAREDIPMKYPDFMEKRDKEDYQSEKVLGQLYRRVQRQAADAKRDLLALPGAIAAGGGACYDPHFEFGVGSVEFQEEVQAALAARAAYEAELVRLMSQYGITSEAELLSGCIVKWSRYYKRRDTYDLKQEISHAVRALRCAYRREFEAGSEEIEEEGENEEPELYAPANAGSGSCTVPHGSGEPAASAAQRAADEAAREQAALVRASAWYYATYHPDCQHQQGGSSSNSGARLYSFAWIVADRLAQIKQARMAAGR